MNKSDSIAQLADALSKAQAEMETAKKDMENPFFKSRYADLASVWDACRGPLGRHGLSVSQMPETHDNQVTVHTLLMHSSGEWISSELTMVPVKADPQGIGSCVTYARRYALSAIVGVSSELDDDGNQASGRQQGAERTTAPIKIPAPPRAAAPASIKGAGPQKAGEPEAAVSGETAAASRQPGEDDDVDELIDMPRRRRLHRAFEENIRNEEARKHSKVWFHDWLKQQGYKDAEGKGSTAGIPMALFDEVLEQACKFAKSLPA